MRCGILFAKYKLLFLPFPHLALWGHPFIRLPRMAWPSKSPLNLNLFYPIYAGTRSSLLFHAYPFISICCFSLPSFPSSVVATGMFELKVRFLVCGKRKYNKFIVGLLPGSGHNMHTPTRQYLCMDIVAVECCR